jgi:hypothetical protein
MFKYLAGLFAILYIFVFLGLYGINIRAAIYFMIVMLLLLLFCLLITVAANDKQHSLHPPALVMIYSIAGTIAISIPLAGSCVFFKKPLDLSNWVHPNEAQLFDFVVYLKDKGTERGLTLPEGNLSIRYGDYNFDGNCDLAGGYHFYHLPGAIFTSECLLRLSNQTKYVFDNNNNEDTLTPYGGAKTVYLKKASAYLKIWGYLTFRGAPLEGARVFIESQEKIDTITDTDGKYVLHLPDNINSDRFVIVVTGKDIARERFDCVAGKSNNFEIATK